MPHDPYGPILARVARLAQAERPVLVAIDGPCGSGKTFLGQAIAQAFPCNLFHMDDFYLPLPARPENWRERPGGNMDFARFHRQVLEPVAAGKAVAYQPYDCKSGRLLPPAELPPKALNVVEGSYCQHPMLSERYDLRVFLTCSPQAQARRLMEREGPRFETFQNLWIPLEEAYFETCSIPSKAHIVLDTTTLF